MLSPIVLTSFLIASASFATTATGLGTPVQHPVRDGAAFQPFDSSTERRNFHPHHKPPAALRPRKSENAVEASDRIKKNQVDPKQALRAWVKTGNRPAKRSTPSSTTCPFLLGPKYFCNPLNGGSDGCTPYATTGYGVTLPPGATFPMYGDVNYHAIPCSQFCPWQSYRDHPSQWTEKSFGVHFEPGSKYIGKNYFDFSDAAAYYGTNGYCITWVQVSLYNQHFGEGGQIPACTCLWV